jgi:DMSO/TMAO reductase YedYZ molybdopterin-dependent catalytic subunit
MRIQRRRLTRRALLTAAATAFSGTGAYLLANRSGLIPPDHGGIFGAGETMTYAAHRVLLSGQPLAREFTRAAISTNFPAINTTMPESAAYRKDMVRGFADWRLTVDGLVARPGELSLADLRAFASRTQITQHVCEQGWTAIAEWTGVQLATVLAAVGVVPQAKYVFFTTVDDWWDSLDMADALHPQTLLAYAMNGRDLPVPHGAPVRLRVERQLGYKNLKYVTGITVTDSTKEWGEGLGAQGAEHGYSWYAGI